VLPQTELERQIATVWQEALQLEKVGIHDNFFELGGHSLLIIQVHRRLQEIVERDITVTELFLHPTIHALAKHLSQPQAQSDATPHQDRAESQRARGSLRKQRQLIRQAARSLR
jgi:aryl carrier-like protein